MGDRLAEGTRAEKDKDTTGENPTRAHPPQRACGEQPPKAALSEPQADGGTGRRWKRNERMARHAHPDGKQADGGADGQGRPRGGTGISDAVRGNPVYRGSRKSMRDKLVSGQPGI